MKKACPVVLRSGKNGYQILAFKHPQAGLQIVKGTIEDGESPEAAAVRELKEESGVVGEVDTYLGAWESGYQNQYWEFYLMSVRSPLPDTWTFYTEDDGGHDFVFFWHPINQSMSNQWHPLFQDAVDFINRAIS